MIITVIKIYSNKAIIVICDKYLRVIFLKIKASYFTKVKLNDLLFQMLQKEVRLM